MVEAKHRLFMACFITKTTISAITVEFHTEFTLKSANPHIKSVGLRLTLEVIVAPARGNVFWGRSTE
jgi:hypothetical protein